MKYYAEVAVPCPLRKTFDYLIPAEMTLQPGMRVTVPFGQRRVVGIVVSIKKNSAVAEKIKYIDAALDTEPLLSEALMRLALWSSQYYQHPLGEVFMSMLPTRLRQGKSIPTLPAPSSQSIAVSRQRPAAVLLNLQQTAALERIQAQTEKFHVFLLYGITGSGKTEVYFRAIDRARQKKQQILFLIPEISLSLQTLQRFQDYFYSEKIGVLHSGLTDKERLITWMQARNGAIQLVIGTRSAVFTPFKNLGLILVDEEHDPSFKQQDGFRYSARDLAIKRAHGLNIPVILGSATPSAESYQHALNKKYELLTLTQRAGNASIPTLQCLYAPLKCLQHGLMPETIACIQQRLKAREQVLIFINRRGYAPTWFCQSCHWQAHCSRCASHLVLHKKDKKLVCHHCGGQEKIQATCPQCHSRSLLALGEGTQRIAENMEALFPTIPIVRMDRDNVKNKQQLADHLASIHQHAAALLIGTQMLAKGHHFPNVTLVVILGIDHGLMSHDFHALENTAQLIVQVAGRAGRVDKPGIVILQTRQPQHPQLQRLLQQNYENFLQILLQERQQFHLPPFTCMALLRVASKHEEKTQQAIGRMQEHCQIQRVEKKITALTVYDPVPAPLPRKAGYYHYQLLIQAPQRSMLQRFLTVTLPIIQGDPEAKKVRWSIEVDPIDFF